MQVVNGTDLQKTTPSWQRPAILAAAAAGLIALGAVGARVVTQSSLPAPIESGVPLAANSNAPTYGPATGPARSSTAPGNSGHSARPVEPLPTRPAVAQAQCVNCAIIESVTPVTHKGPSSGVGAVAGGVLGGVVGHQIGGGNGRNAMTVLGALGGGLAGNEIEKRRNEYTDYRVTLRMADGERRTLTQSRAPAVGSWVRVDGDRLVRLESPPAYDERNPRALNAGTRS